MKNLHFLCRQQLVVLAYTESEGNWVEWRTGVVPDSFAKRVNIMHFYFQVFTETYFTGRRITNIPSFDMCIKNEQKEGTDWYVHIAILST